MSFQALEKGKTKNTIRLEKIQAPGYEKVVRATCDQTNLHALIAIHNTKLGPALGGTRIYPYKSEKEALFDVLRLSKGMTYKSAMAGVGFGGGKSVIIADPKTEKTEALLRSFGEAVEALKGEYIAAEDVGCTTQDALTIRKSTQYIVGLPHEKSSGDPGKFTAWGTFKGIEACMMHLFKNRSVFGKKILIQGLGNVGAYLGEYLFWQGADLYVSDIDRDKLKKYAKDWGACIVAPDQIFDSEMDVFAPCAMGGIIDDTSLAKIRCKAIAGSANNQLLEDKHAEILLEKNILYAPDYVINAGGLLNVAEELEKEGYNPKHSRKKTDAIYEALLAIFEIADKKKISTHKAASTLAEYRLQYGVGKRTCPPTFHHTI